MIDAVDNIALHTGQAMKSIDWKAYSNWLTKEGYQPSTIEATLRNIKVVHEEWVNLGKTLSQAVFFGCVRRNHIAHIKRYMRFVERSQKNPLGGAFLKCLQIAGFEPSCKRRKHGRRLKALLSYEDYAQLKAKLRRGEDTSKLLCAYMGSGVRISTFLNWRVRDIDENSLQDKISREWLQSHSPNRPLVTRTQIDLVYQILCETERCAYSRLLKRLQDVAEGLGLSVDLDTVYKSYTRNLQ